MGLCVIPLKPREKTPAIEWKPYQVERPSSEALTSWFGNGANHNAGIPLGKVSGVVVVESDSDEAEEWCAANLPATPMMTRSKRGVHRYYRRPDRDDIPAFYTIGKSLKIEIKRDGQYVVGPGSLHPSGHVYSEIAPWPSSTSALPELPLTGLKRQQPKTTKDRNNTLFAAALDYAKLGSSEDEVVAFAKTFNADNFVPPLPEHEVESTARSAARYAPSQGERKLTDVGNGELFAAHHKHDVRYNHVSEQFLLLDEQIGIWKPDTTEQVRGYATAVVRAELRTATEIPDSGDRKAAIKWYGTTSESTSGISNMLREGRHLPPIADAGEGWDLPPFLLGTQNGVVDLRTGYLRRGLPEERITLMVTVPYSPEATCPTWERTLAEVFADHPELVPYLQRALGYSLTGDCREECFFVTWGAGGNGKGTVMNTISRVLGPYADDVPFSTLEQKERNSIPADLAKLVNKRFVTASESSETTQLNEARIKALTGRDPITARYLHKNFFTFQPVAKFWLATNQKPVVRDDSDGFWRRVHLIPFTQSFVGKADLHLKDTLLAEAPGILSWVVRGSLLWQREGLNPPTVVTKATEDYRRESDPLSPFIEACCVVRDDLRVQSSILFAEYQRWCDDNQIKPWERFTLTTFGSRMKKRFKSAQERHVYYEGLALRSDREEP